MLSSSGLTEEGVEGIISSSSGLITGHQSVRLDPMFQAVKLPAGIANLDAGLTNVHRDTLTLWRVGGLAITYYSSHVENFSTAGERFNKKKALLYRTRQQIIMTNAVT